MTIQYCSDLHLEFPENENWLKEHPIIPAGEVLVLAGDIVPFVQMEQYGWFFDKLSQQYEAVYWLPGNHEYYGSYIDERSGSFKEAIRANVWLLNNEAVQHGNMTLICSTLWSFISPATEWDIAKGMVDYRCIRKHGERFRPIHTFRLHKTCRQFITQAVTAAKGPICVATHHVPTFMHYPAAYRHSLLNEAFATELFPFIEQSHIAAWLYGHHHHNTPAFTIGETTMLTNQLGYVRAGEQNGFDPHAALAIDSR
ncbi:metallophosphoesterase [Taibaiella koreensis]|uniref:metallophosphoesterase n=1 Tax=Taibaiella koreensis TaxID=1268548 RepID=UPI000E5A0C81|nr:metallophosphoesterase [Taibaiella koreensis]